MDTHPNPLNFASTWQEYARHNMSHRYADAEEIAFWHEHALGYEAQLEREAQGSSETCKVIEAYLQSGDSLLDVGAGSGRFTIPFADSVAHITALDLSPTMLDILKRKADAQRKSNITTVCGNWEVQPIEPHDVVLAAWSLYRQHDILKSLQKLIDTTQRTLIIVDGDYAPRPSDDPPHECLKTEIWGGGDQGICNYLYFAGMLRQCRVRAQVHVVHETIKKYAPTPHQLALQFAPDDATDAELATFTSALSNNFRQTSNGYCYRYQVAVGVVIWQRPMMEGSKWSL